MVLPLRLLLEDPKKSLLSCLEHRAKALSSDPGSAWVCPGIYVGFGGLDEGAQHCRRLGVLTVPVAQWEPWHVRDLRLLSDVLRLAGASEKRS